MRTKAFDGDYRLTSGYGKRTLNGVTAFHYGVDYSHPLGVKLKVPDTFNGSTVRLAQADKYGGKYIQLRRADGKGLFYLHIGSFLKKVGDKVKTGDVIALSGNTGNSTGPHTHIGAQRVATDWDSFEDPIPYISLFKVGDKIQFTGVQNIRHGSGTSYSPVRDSKIGEVATIKDGHRHKDNYVWWDLQLKDGSGWVADVNKFKIYSVPTTPPVEPPITPPTQTECEKRVIQLLEEIDSLKVDLGTSKNDLKVQKEVNIENNKEMEQLQKRLDNVSIERNRFENNYNKSVSELNSIKSGRFYWIIGLLDKLFSKKKITDLLKKLLPKK